MKKINTIINPFLFFVFLFLSGCSSTIQVTSNASNKNDDIITEKEFIENIRGKNVTVAFKTGQSKDGMILSLRDNLISFTEDGDTIDIPRMDIQSIAHKHKLTGVVSGLFTGLFMGGGFGFAIGSLSRDKESWDFSDIGGLIIGGVIGSLSGIAIGICVPPTTIYEFDSSGEIYENQQDPNHFKKESR